VKLPGGKTAMVGRVGKGAMILADPGNYNYDRNVGEEAPARGLLEKAIQMAGVKGVVRVVNASDGTPANGVWAAGWRQGRQRYVTVTRDYQLADHADLPVRLLFDQKGHIYEMRSGRYCGYGDSATTLLRTARGQVFSVLPYRVRDLRSEIGGSPRRGQDLVLQVRLATEGQVQAGETHLLRLSVKDPRGREVTALRRLATISGGLGEVRLPLAYDDPPGSWTVQLRDSATGLTREQTYRLP
jgi:hypothetical protein